MDHFINRRDFLCRTGASEFLATVSKSVFAKDNIMQRSIPKSGEKISMIGLGAWRAFDVKLPSNSHRDCFQILFEKGGGMIDTSPMYGRAERIVGQLLKFDEKRNTAFLATKVGSVGRDQGVAQMNESLHRLKKDRIDLMQIHNLVDWRTQLETLKL